MGGQNEEKKKETGDNGMDGGKGWRKGGGDDFISS